MTPEGTACEGLRGRQRGEQQTRAWIPRGHGQRRPEPSDLTGVSKELQVSLCLLNLWNQTARGSRAGALATFQEVSCISGCGLGPCARQGSLNSEAFTFILLYLLMWLFIIIKNIQILLKKWLSLGTE